MAHSNSTESRRLARTAKEIKHYRVLMRILPIAASCLTLVVVIIYIASLFYKNFGSFTVSINRFDNIEYSLSLSETPDFLKATSRLNTKASEQITNISVNDLPADLDNINGAHSGDNYLAYTFYLKNTGEKAFTFEYAMFIDRVTNNLDHAVRVRLYVNGDYTDYARTRDDGGGAEPGTVEFLTENTIVRKQMENFKPGDMVRFTVVIWLEGDDPECLDPLIGGEMDVSMTFSLISEAMV